jgi:uncharacterized protein YmfQ (DUF2313 family)
MTTNETERALDLLMKLVYDGGQIAFSGKSLDIVVSRLKQQLRAVTPGKESKLLDYWESQLPLFRRALINQATRTRMLGKDDAPLVTEDAAVFATRMCPGAPDLP